jgi:hypothetical protein
MIDTVLLTWSASLFMLEEELLVKDEWAHRDKHVPCHRHERETEPKSDKGSIDS